MPGLYEIYKDKLSDLEIYEKDDRYKEAKQQEVMCWYEDYFKILYGDFTNHFVEKLKEIFKDCTLWIKVSDFGDAGDIRLDRALLGRKLLDLKYDNIPLFSQIIRYNIACRCGFEEQIKNIFDGLLSADQNSINREYPSFRHLISGNPSREALIERFQKHDKLVAFWSYWINRDIPEVSDKLKALIGLDNSESLEENRQCLYEYGIKNAEGYRYLESLEFFWERLPEKKGELLIEAALYASKGSSSNTISWCLRSLEACHQRKLAVKISEKGCRIFSVLSVGHFWQDIMVSLSHLNPSDVTSIRYELWICSVSTFTINSPAAFMKSGVKLLSFLWSVEGFDEHRKSYLDNLLCRDELITLFKIGETEIVCTILGMANKKQLNRFLDSCMFRRSYFDIKKCKKDDLIKLFDCFKPKDRFAVENFLKKNDPDNLEKIMRCDLNNTSNPYSYLAQSSTILDLKHQLEGTDSNINFVTTQQINFYKRNFCHYPLL